MSRIDDGVLRALQQAHGPALLLYFERRTNPPEDAALLLNDLMVVLWRRSASAPTEPEQVRMWMFGIARKLVMNQARSGRRRAALAQRLREELALMQPSLPTEEALAVRQAVQGLPKLQRELVRLVHWDGFSLAEAARITGIGASTARSRYALARTKLARELGTMDDVGDAALVTAEHRPL